MSRLSILILAMLASGTAAAQPAPRAHDGGPIAAVPADAVASWPAGTFLESVAVDGAGVAYVVHHDDHAIDRVTAGKIERLAHFPGEIAGILPRPEGGFLVSGRVEDGTHVIYAVSVAGAVTTLANVPEAGFLNGLAWLEPGIALVADSDAGTIWQIDVASKRVTVWKRDPLLDHADPATHFPANTGFPAANGVKRYGNAVYVSNSGRAEIMRIPVLEGGKAGPVTVWARDIVADDFAFDAAGDAFVPTHPKQSVVRLRRDGIRTTIATPAQGIAGPTAATFGPDGSLYVVGNSGIPIEGVRRPASLVRLDVRVATAPSATSLRQIVSPNYVMVTAPTIAGSDGRRREHGQQYLRFLEANYGRIAFGGQVKGLDGAVVERVYFVQAATTDEARALMAGSPYFQNRVYGPLTARPVQGMLGSLIGGVAWPAPKH